MPTSAPETHIGACCRGTGCKKPHCRRGRASFDRRAALRQPLRRSGAGLPRRRPDRRTDHRVSRAIFGSFVIARNTAMTFKGKPVDAKAIGKDLGVRYVLEGSVQPSGDKMRVNAQLIDAGNGALLWAEPLDTPAPIYCRRRTRWSRV